ncbi:MAG: alpha/beta fold hydrolase [Verrucomicrobiales bacterium]|nr:alpha/beta fold hydrolase [Verrucomicrobiales bacterium]MCP5560482.1 alpha/beta fold hydrolase [Verrucomicrobiaceae bacterium]
MSLTRRLLRLITIAVLTPVIFLLGCQSQMIYQPRGYEAAQLEMLRKADGVNLTYTTSQGSQTAFYIPPWDKANREPTAIWVCFGGNGSLALDWLYYTDNWDSGNAYLLVDYPGYGKCAGSPNPARIQENIRAAAEALTTHLGAKDIADLRPRLRVMGHSLGAAAALLAADELKVNRIILLAPFTSMTDMANKVLFWPLGYLNRHRYDNRPLVKKLASDGAQITLFHGVDDGLIPPEMSKALAAIDPQHVKVHLVERAEHNDVIYLASGEIRAEMAK